VTTKRSLLLCSPSEEDEIRWLGAVRALIARRSGVGVVSGTGLPKVNNAPTSEGTTSTFVPGVPSSGGGSGLGNLKHKGRRSSGSGSTGIPE
jgi:hypothetical protein